MSHAAKRARKEKAATPAKEEDDVIVTAVKDTGASALAKHRPPRKAYVPEDDDLDTIDVKGGADRQSRTGEHAGAGPGSDSEQTSSASEVISQDLTEESSRALVAEGEQLSGNALKDFLKKNFTDFIDEKMLDFVDIEMDV